MLKYLILMIYILFFSCCGLHNEIKYQSGEVIITRIDECGKSSFFYGNNINEDSAKIWVEYSGINDGFSGYLEFDENGKVTLLPSDGYFKSENINTKFFELDTAFTYETPKIGLSICSIMLSTRYEREANEKGKTGIKITYNMDDNEWW